MKLHLTSSLVFSALALAACSSAPTTGTGTDDLSSDHPVCDPLKCPNGEHWSSSECRCVPDGVCDPIVCKDGEHWSSSACACVADCTIMWECIVGEHWDADACKCVPGPSTSAK